MRSLRVLWLPSLMLLIFAASGIAQNTDTSGDKVYAFANGNWFDGKKFEKRVFYSVGGVLRKKKPERIDETVDLGGRFVIPPFGDAHTHNLDGGYNMSAVVARYKSEGTFYVQVLGNWTSGAKDAKRIFNKPGSLDVNYANASLTSTYGHPFTVFEPLALGIYDPAEVNKRMAEVMKSRLGENDAYVFFDSIADVDAKWPRFIESQPDIVKIILIDAKNYQTLHTNGKAGDKGLSPEVAEYVVKKAHAAGRRVAAHVETAADFRLGLRIGVDVFAHAPGYGWDGKTVETAEDILAPADLKLAARKKVVVVPTAKRGDLSVTISYNNDQPVFDAARRTRVIERQRRLFTDFRRYGVRIALGTDLYGRTAMPEIMHLYDNQILDNLTLLKIAVEDTPRSIFPNRKIGRLMEGFEASFITVDENPLFDFGTLKNIKFRFKQGLAVR